MISLLVLVLIDSLIWAVWSFIVGYFCNKIPNSYFKRERFGVSPKSVRVWEKLGIKRWKDIVPEAGAMFSGGESKKQLSSLDEVGLRNAVVNARRAELVHWLILCITPVFFFFNPPVLIVAMVAYGFFANVPFIGIQRYNNGRAQRALARRQ